MQHGGGQNSAEVANLLSANVVFTARHSHGNDAESTKALFYLLLLVGKMLFQAAVLWGGCTVVMSLLYATAVVGMDNGDTRGWVVGGDEQPGLTYSRRIQHCLVHTWFKSG